MATLEQHRMLEAIISGMSLTSKELIDLLGDYVSPMELLAHIRDTQPDELGETCLDIFWNMTEGPAPYRSWVLFPDDKQRESIVRSVKGILVEHGYMKTLSDVLDDLVE